jgi:hypothetical protein
MINIKKRASCHAPSSVYKWWKTVFVSAVSSTFRASLVASSLKRVGMLIASRLRLLLLLLLLLLTSKHVTDYKCDVTFVQCQFDVFIIKMRLKKVLFFGDRN